jgi:hypothetical protein
VRLSVKGIEILFLSNALLLLFHSVSLLRFVKFEKRKCEIYGFQCISSGCMIISIMSASLVFDFRVISLFPILATNLIIIFSGILFVFYFNRRVFLIELQHSLLTRLFENRTLIKLFGILFASNLVLNVIWVWMIYKDLRAYLFIFPGLISWSACGSYFAVWVPANYVLWCNEKAGGFPSTVKEHISEIKNLLVMNIKGNNSAKVDNSGETFSKTFGSILIILFLVPGIVLALLFNYGLHFG